MKQFFKVIFNIFKGLTRILFWAVLVIVTAIIRLVTYEPGTKGYLTKRKAKRIRLLTRFKMWFLNTLPVSVNKFLGLENYKLYLNKHLGNGMQLRYERTDKRAV